jgi:hypothetical protein
VDKDLAVRSFRENAKHKLPTVWHDVVADIVLDFARPACLRPMLGSGGHYAAKVTLNLLIGRVNVPFQELPHRLNRSLGFNLIIGKSAHEESGGSGGEAISSRGLDDLRFSTEGSLVVRSV